MEKTRWMYGAALLGILLSAAAISSHGALQMPVLKAGDSSSFGTLQATKTIYLQLDLSACTPQMILNVEALDVNRKSELVGTDVKGSATLMLMANVLGERPVAIPLGNGLWSYNNGTVTDSAAYKLARAYHLLHLNLSQYTVSAPWTVGLLNDATWAKRDVNYSMRAWCTDTPSCPRDCSGLGNCSITGVCDCELGRGGKGCASTVDALPDGMVFDRVLAVDEWNYFSYDLGDENQSLLVELWRERGDSVLFVKRRDEGFVPYGVPNVFDFAAHADAVSFRERLDYHHVLVNEASSDMVVGVYNYGVELQEDAVYSISARSAPSGELGILCPKNCSYPNGECGSDGNSTLCFCNSGYAGRYCEGSYTVASLDTPFEGVLQPGEWMYVEYTFNEQSNTVVIGFEREGGQATLVAKADGVPTFSDNLYRLASPPSNASQRSIFSLNSSEPLHGKFVFGVYNKNYRAHGPCHFSLDFSLQEGELSLFSSGLFIAVFLTVVASLSICLCLGVSRIVIVYRRHVESRNPGNGGGGSVGEKGIDASIIAAFPLVTYVKGGSTTPDDAHCAVCLGDYEESDILRKLPKCEHRFHVDCIDAWLRSHSTCPLCRLSLQSAAASESPQVGLPVEIPHILTVIAPLSSEISSPDVHPLNRPTSALVSSSMGSFEGREEEGERIVSSLECISAGDEEEKLRFSLPTGLGSLGFLREGEGKKVELVALGTHQYGEPHAEEMKGGVEGSSAPLEREEVRERERERLRESEREREQTR